MNFNDTLHRIISVTLTVCGFVVATVGPIVVMLSKNPDVTSNATLAKILAAVGSVVTACGVISTALQHWTDTQVTLAVLKKGDQAK